ncbi:MAG TPA: GerMN domain-containing protein [Propionicimonas sp.]|uniref:GerMN domain-containing protein n=1 Tax=Propionicimonas sp. TaxID=1955623 RepID=UPI002F40B1C0
MRATSWLAAPLVLVLAVTGCATVPTSGPVEHHTPQAAGVNTGVHVDPLPPANGASQQLVVEGFLHAMGVYQPNYGVARQYLTPTASEGWHPESGVEVYTESDQLVESDQGVALSYVQVGSVDASGIYLSDNTNKRYIFELSKDPAGQWRIVNPPAGLMVSRYMFTTNYTAVNLHFLNSAGDVLVPDPRFFASGEQAPAAVVRAQLDGPSAWLEPVVQKVATADVGVEGVTIQADGVVDVRLAAAAGALPVEQRTALLSELAYTMTGLPAVSAVQVSAGGPPWQSDFGTSQVAPQTFASRSPTNTSAPRVLFTISDGKLKRLRDPSRWDDLVDVESGVVKPEQIAVRSDLGEVAAITGSGTQLQTAPLGEGKPKVLRVGSALLRPDYARNGELWSFASSGSDNLRVYRDATPLKVDASALPKGQIVAAKVSQDGARIAVALRQGNRTEVGLAVVARTQGAVRLAGWHAIDLTMNTGTAGRAIDVGWVSATELAVLQIGSGGETSVIRVSQDGAAATDIGPSNSGSVEQLAAIPGRTSLALDAGGGVYRFDGEFTWTLSLTTVEAMTYSG